MALPPWACIAAIYHWFLNSPAKMYYEAWGSLHFPAHFIGTNLNFFPSTRSG